MPAVITYWDLAPDTAERLAGTDVFDNPVDPAQLSAFLADPVHYMTCASDADRVVGFASGTILLHPDKAPMLFVNEVEVAEEYRRRGIASELLSRLFQWAEEQGCVTCWLATEDDNLPARALYRSARGRERTGLVMYEWGEKTEPETEV